MQTILPPLLNEIENAKAAAFASKHYRKHKKTASVILTAVATGLGYNVKVECPHCRKSEDISDYASW